MNPASGGNHYKLGDGTFVDMHDYNQPIHIFEGVFDPKRPFVLGEYGGLGRNMPGHRWYERDSQTYNTFPNEKAMTDAYVKLIEQIEEAAKGYKKDGKKISFSAAVYTQTTDVETEVNGIMTYDREIVKFDENRIREAAERLTSLYDNNAGAAVPFVEGTGDVTYYTVTGIRLDSPVPGINIVKEKDGSVHKVMVPHF